MKILDIKLLHRYEYTYSHHDIKGNIVRDKNGGVILHRYDFPQLDGHLVGVLMLTDESPIVVWGNNNTQCCEWFRFTHNIPIKYPNKDMDAYLALASIIGATVNNVMCREYKTNDKVNKGGGWDDDANAFEVTVSTDKCELIFSFMNSHNGYYAHMVGVASSFLTKNTSI